MTAMELVVAGSYSIAAAVTIALARIRKIHRSYRPFVCILFAALLAEVASFLLIHLFRMGNALACNMLGLAEGLLWLWQFRIWDKRHNPNILYRLLVAVISTVWVFENIILARIDTFSSTYSILYSFILVFLSINQLNRLIIEETGNLFFDSKFLICSGTILFYTYRIFIESFYLFEMEQCDVFLSNVFIILAIVNLLVNLLFALATLWIPSRQKFSPPSF